MYTKKIIALLFLISITVLFCGRQEADIILRNGDIHTLEDDQPWARAVVITGNKIIAVLDDETKADKYVGPSTRIVDLNGKLAVPGFIDAHVHFAGFSAQQHDIMLMNVDDDEGLIKELKRVVPLVGDGEWITGGEWSGAILWEAAKGEIKKIKKVNRWEPDRSTIDEITKNNPCFLSSYDGELYLANTAALKAAGLENTKLDGMKFHKGKASGLIYKGSPAIEKIRAVINPKSEERILNEIGRAHV